MNYWVSRGGQQYGPYSLADLQKYVAQGNIVGTDLACGEGQTQWVPVAQVLAASAPTQPPRPQQPVMQQPAQPYAVQQPSPAPQPVYQAGVGATTGPLPPGLHWAIVLLLAFVTCGLFSIVWLFIQANFVKQIRPQSNAMMLYILGLAVNFCAGLIVPFTMRSMGFGPLLPIFYLGGLVLIIMGHFQMKAAIEEYYNTVEPINLRLSGVMVFFFNVFYFQYHFTRIREWKLTGVWR